MKNFKKISLSLFLTFPMLTFSSNLVNDTKVLSSDIIIFDTPANTKVSVTYKVNSKIYGTYKLCARDVNFPDFAQDVVFNKNGTGYIHLKGLNKSKRNFKWGLYVNKNKLHTYDVDGYKGYVAVWQYNDDNTLLQRPIEQRDNKIGMIGPYKFFMKNGSCR